MIVCLGPRHGLLLAAALLLAACVSRQVEPAWRSDASGALDSFTKEYLAGNSAAAAADFARARSAMSSTGRAALVAHAELLRCAVKTASAEVGECDGFAPLAADATPAERAYAAYLAGHWQALPADLLPPQHQAIARGSAGLAGMSDPLAQLVAAGALLQAGRLAPADIALAIDTASAQGWRRPLLTWLGVAAQRAQAAGDVAEVARIHRRIALVQAP
ncbi:hypothetical protein [Massilia sp. PWRC2]|uniref:hypothetical protein n=1 Tax=Massilia sp. PWRC2 TaxID=2804626 RepID=UPI003CF603AC